MQSGGADRGPVQTGVRWDPSKFPTHDRADTDSLRDNPVVVLTVSLLFLVIGVWAAVAMVPIAIELRNGVHTTGTAHDRGTDGDAEWWVTFKAAGKTETHPLLPEGSIQKMTDDGDRIEIVYNPANPSHVARESDIDPGHLILFAGWLLIPTIGIATSSVTLFRRRPAAQQRGTAA